MRIPRLSIRSLLLVVAIAAVGMSTWARVRADRRRTLEAAARLEEDEKMRRRIAAQILICLTEHQPKKIRCRRCQYYTGNQDLPGEMKEALWIAAIDARERKKILAQLGK
jgi:hypothetical protein